MSTLVIGVDPGETTGILAWQPDAALPQPLGVQVHGPEGVVSIVLALLDRHARENARWDRLAPKPIVAVEEYVVGSRAGRVTHRGGGHVARQLIAQLLELDADAHVTTRPAAVVKPWATDRRLDAAGLLTPTDAGMRHARDAARHALYAAVHDGLTPDPLSRKAANR